MEQFLFIAKIIFWISLILIIHCYFIFPITLPFISEIFKRKVSPKTNQSKLVKVSVLISAYNEEDIIEKKILNLLQVDYPKELLEILIGDDGSADQTTAIVERYADQGVTLVRAEKNAGKAAMLNRLQSLATGDILVFCDANTMFFPNVIRELTAPFENEKIGCACGHLILSDASGTALGQGESSYWDLESEIKKFEGMLDRLIGGNGALYAIRKHLYTKLPIHKSVMDDFFITVKILQKGYRCTFISEAIGTEMTSQNASGEFRRKIRIGRANYNFLFSYLPLLNPFKPLIAYLFFSHKLLRWFTPHLGILCVLASAALVLTKSPFYIAVFAMIFLSLLLGALKIIPQAYYFLSMNFALLKGFFLSFKKEHGGGWKREKRSLLTSLLAALCILSATPSESAADVGATFEIGTLNPTEHLGHFNLDIDGHLWYRFDQMVFFGIGSGYTDIGDSYYVPLTGAVWLRLPFGSTVLPVFTGDYGYAFGNDKRLIWRLGGGFDIKNGDRSSLVVTAGYKKLSKRGGYIYLHGGLLLEF